MAITPSTPNPGYAQFQTDTVGGLVELRAGDTPAAVTVMASFTLAQGTAGIPAHTPVFVANEGAAVQLVDGTTITKANAITTSEIPAGSPAGNVGVYKALCVNVRALNWPASFTTDAQKLAAFDLSSCQIYAKIPYYS